jgi:hypothetical protein
VNPPRTLTIRILIIFCQPDDYEDEVVVQNDCDVSKRGYYVAYQRLDGQENHYNTHPESMMLFSAKIDQTIRVAPVHWITGPIAVYRDYDFRDKKALTGLHPTDWYGVIRPKQEWPLIFADRAYNDKSAHTSIPPSTD